MTYFDALEVYTPWKVFKSLSWTHFFSFLLLFNKFISYENTKKKKNYFIIIINDFFICHGLKATILFYFC